MPGAGGRLHQTTAPVSFLLKAVCPEVGPEAPLWGPTFPAAWGWKDITQNKTTPPPTSLCGLSSLEVLCVASRADGPSVTPDALSSQGTDPCGRRAGSPLHQEARDRLLAVAGVGSTPAPPAQLPRSPTPQASPGAAYIPWWSLSARRAVCTSSLTG